MGGVGMFPNSKEGDGIHPPKVGSPLGVDANMSVPVSFVKLREGCCEENRIVYNELLQGCVEVFLFRLAWWYP